MRRVPILLALLILLGACGGPSAGPAPTAAPTAPSPTAAPTAIPPTAVPTAPSTAAPTTQPPTFAPAAPVRPASPTPAPNAQPTAATPTSTPAGILLGNTPVQGELTGAPPYYQLSVPAGGIVTATLTVDPAAPRPVKLILLDKNQRFIVDRLVEAGQTGPLSRIFPDTYGGTVYLVLEGQGRFTLQAQAAEQNDGSGTRDAGGTFAQALPLAPGDYQGLLGDEDQADFYSLELPQSAGVLSATLESDRAHEHTVKLALFNPGQTFVTDVTVPFDAPAPLPLVWRLEAGQGGRWYLLVTGKGNYRLHIRFNG